MGVGEGEIRFSINLSQSRASSLLRSFRFLLFPPKSSNTLSRKHHREPKECSVAEEELTRGPSIPVVLLALGQFAAAVLGWQARCGGLPTGQTRKGCGKGRDSSFYSEAEDYVIER